MTIVCPLTDGRSRKSDILNVPVAAGTAGLAKDSVVLCNQIRAVDRARFGAHIGKLPDATIQAVDRGLREILDL
jgi:mRNA interferase MazF